LELFQGLEQSGIDNFQYLLTGYLPNASTVTAIGTIAKTLKKKNPDILWSIFLTSWTLTVVLDPVMGDNGALYVAEEVVPIYKSIVPFADIILPNQFEAELLSNCKVDTLESISVCLKKLHQTYRVVHIVITSVRLSSHPGVILCCGSTATTQFEPRPFMVRAPVIDGPFVGTGDLFASLLLARLHPFIDHLTPHQPVTAIDLPLARAVEMVVASMQGVLRETKTAMDRELRMDSDVTSLTEKERHIRKMRACELRLVGSQDALLHPEVVVRAVVL
jgi:pyridoxine kinase